MIDYQIMAADLVLQFTAVYLVLRLMRISPKTTAWSLFALAIVFLALHRVFTTYRWVSTGVAPPLVHELICLSTSSLLLAAVALIGPLFRRIKETEWRLRQSEEKYRTIVETAHEGIEVLDAQDRITYVNPRMSEILGYSSAELLGHQVLEFFDEAGKKKMQKNLARRKHGTKEITEFCLPRKDGSQIWIRAAQSPILSSTGEYLGAIGLISDITEHNRLEASLKARAGQQAAVADLGQTALAGGSLTTLFNYAAILVSQYLNVEFSEVLEVLPRREGWLLRAGVGWRPELLGSAVLNLNEDFLTNKAAAIVRSSLDRKAQNETRLNSSEVLREHGIMSGMRVLIAGRERPFGILGAHTPRPQAFSQDDKNFLQAMANVLAGALEHRRTEETLRESEKRLRYLTSQLLLGQEKERKKISLELHEDLGQTLQALKMQASCVKKGLEANQEGLSQECETLLQHIGGIINRVRGLSWELMPNMLEDLGLQATLRHLLDDFSEQYGIKNCQTDFEEIDDLFPAAEQITIFRIFQGALSNIGAHAQATRIALSIKKNGHGQICFSIKDNGRGFDVEAVLSQPGDAAGYGLYAMEERAKMLGGSLRIESRPGRGTELRLSLPSPQSR
jgi:PAS domain S-box-containing protein